MAKSTFEVEYTDEKYHRIPIPATTRKFLNMKKGKFYRVTIEEIEKTP